MESVTAAMTGAELWNTCTEARKDIYFLHLACLQLTSDQVQGGPPNS